MWEHLEGAEGRAAQIFGPRIHFYSQLLCFLLFVVWVRVLGDVLILMQSICVRGSPWGRISLGWGWGGRTLGSAAPNHTGAP